MTLPVREVIHAKARLIDANFFKNIIAGEAKDFW